MMRTTMRSVHISFASCSSTKGWYPSTEACSRGAFIVTLFGELGESTPCLRRILLFSLIPAFEFLSSCRTPLSKPVASDSTMHVSTEAVSLDISSLMQIPSLSLYHWLAWLSHTCTDWYPIRPRCFHQHQLAFTTAHDIGRDQSLSPLIVMFSQSLCCHPAVVIGSTLG
jgi:hypothetical protein